MDKVHIWAPKERQRELLYLLSRDRQNYQVIILANNLRFLSGIDQSVRPTHQPELIHFRNYNAVEIGKIISERAKQGIKRPDTSVISKIAAYTVKKRIQTSALVSKLYSIGRHTEGKNGRGKLRGGH